MSLNALAHELSQVKTGTAKANGIGDPESGDSHETATTLCSDVSAPSDSQAVAAQLPPWALALMATPQMNLPATGIVAQQAAGAPTGPLPPMLLAASVPAGQMWNPRRLQLPLLPSGTSCPRALHAQQQLFQQQQRMQVHGEANSSGGPELEQHPVMLGAQQLEQLQALVPRVEAGLPTGCRLLCLLPCGPPAWAELCGVVLLTPVGGAGAGLWLHEQLARVRRYRTCQTAYEAAEVSGRLLAHLA